MFARSLPVAVTSDDTNLISEGIIDSLALVELIFRIENDFGIVLDLERIEISDFETIANIAGLIARSQTAQEISTDGWQ